VTNAGGLDPDGCAAAVAQVAEKLGLHPKIAYVRGDDLLPRMGDLIAANQLTHFETGEPIKDASAFLTANAYFGGWGIADALARGADIVITGRVTDAAVVCGPAAWHHGWSRTDWDALAGAVAAGHVIECGTQATGGNYSFFTEVKGMERTGFPWAEIAADGSSVIGKHDGTGGEVSIGTVTSQLLYEIGGPEYFGPDVTTRFDTIQLEQQAKDRVRMYGIRGEPPPATLKVCINRPGGFRNDMSVCLTGLDIEAKAKLIEDAFWLACPYQPEDFAQVTTRFDTISLEQIARDRVRMSGIRGEPPPATLKVCINRPGGFRNDMSVCLTGLDIEAKAKLIQDAFWVACPYRPEDFAHVSTRLSRTDKEDPASNEQAVAILKISVKDPDAEKVGRAFSNAVTELGLATIPGFFGVGGGPGEGRPFGVYEPACVPAAELPQQVVIRGGETRMVASVVPRTEVKVAPAPGPTAATPAGPSTRAPIGRVVGTRSGDKGGNANLGVFARSEAAWAWLDAFLTIDRLRELLPEIAPLSVRRYRLPALRSLNFVIHGLLEEGVAASTRQDPQAKSLGEWLRARVVELPQALLS